MSIVWRVVAGAMLGGLVVAAGSLQVLTIEGGSMAPTLLWGDFVLANRAAYDLVVPYTESRVAAWRTPSRGDIVSFRVPNRDDGSVGFKRVIAVPGDVIEMREQRLTINGQTLGYELQEIQRERITPANHLGGMVAAERGAGMDQTITYTPGMPSGRTFGPLQVPQGHYFLLGDNRDRSNDSRAFGPVARERIMGQLLGVLRRNELRGP